MTDDSPEGMHREQARRALRLSRPARVGLVLLAALLVGTATWDRLRVEQKIRTQRQTIALLSADVADGVERNYGVLCAWLFTLAANPPPDPTPDQKIRFEFYGDLYQGGVEGTPGLECPRPLPPD